MKPTNLSIIITLALFGAAVPAWTQTINGPVEFDWTAQGTAFGRSQNASFIFSGGTIANGIFTPSGRISSTFDSAIFGPATYNTDTSFGPSFLISGVIQPLAFEDIFQLQNDESFDFQNLKETITFHDTNPADSQSVNGTWKVTGLPVPETPPTALLFAASAGGLALLRKRLA